MARNRGLSDDSLTGGARPVTPAQRRVRPQSSPQLRSQSKGRPQSAFGGTRSKTRPLSAPAVVSDRLLKPLEGRWSAEDEGPPGKDWIRGDWTAGWIPNPVKVAFPRWTIPSSDRGKGEKEGGFRETYLSIEARNKSHIPGAGAYKAFKDFVEPATSDSFGKPDTKIKEKRWTPRHLRKSSEEIGCLRGVPDPGKEGDETDAKRLIRSRPSSARIPTQARNASLTDLRQAIPSTLPTSFLTPGPGAYTQFSCFGQPSGACRRGYLGTLPSNNPKKYKNIGADDEGEFRINSKTRRKGEVSGRTRLRTRSSSKT